jgi:2,4-dienoyl-CoA reductase-like NADH-dependent reductase (Old Yellow Enzyme family)
MSGLFEPTQIRNMTLTNRFVRSATWEGMAREDGACTPKLVQLMAQLAEGGVGLIITSHTYVRRDGQASPWQLGVYSDDLIPGLREMAKAVHDHGGKIVMQLAHSGIMANPKTTGQPNLGPSQKEGLATSPGNEMSIRDIRELVEAFGQAAARAKATGFDGVQIHAAHGYLLSQFLSPAFNRRTDAYGGPIENRARALLDVLGAVRKAVGRDYPVLVKMNCQDFLDGGLVAVDSRQAAVMLAEGGIDAIELSGGTLISKALSPSRTAILSEEKEAYFQDAARAFREKLRVPIILVGGVRSLQVAERLVKEGVADYISMSRPLIREPGLINRWKSGDLRRATCISDNQCFVPAFEGAGIYCLTERKERKKRTVSESQE